MLCRKTKRRKRNKRRKRASRHAREGGKVHAEQGAAATAEEAAESDGEAASDADPPTLHGVMVGGALYLVDKASCRVFSSQRDPEGRLVQVRARQRIGLVSP